VALPGIVSDLTLGGLTLFSRRLRELFIPGDNGAWNAPRVFKAGPVVVGSGVIAATPSTWSAIVQGVYQTDGGRIAVFVTGLGTRGGAGQRLYAQFRWSLDGGVNWIYPAYAGTVNPIRTATIYPGANAEVQLIWFDVLDIGRAAELTIQAVAYYAVAGPPSGTITFSNLVLLALGNLKQIG